MKRITSHPRPDWQAIVESQGFYFHTLDREPYWNESAYYAFTRRQIDELERATYALDNMCLAAVQYVIDNDRLDDFLIPARLADFVMESWERDEFTLYGRFDLAYDGVDPPKLLEYNADTPTSLLEAAVIQWFWFKDVHPRLDQFNSIHERLIEAWRSFGDTQENLRGHRRVHLACIDDNVEDFMTTHYLRDTAVQAGLETKFIGIREIGWSSGARRFVDLREHPIDACFKLYPWEWMTDEEFSSHLPDRTTAWLEAPWKMILSNKAILAVLHEMFPESPYLLEADYEPLANGSYARKPILSREGANIQLVDDGRLLLETPGAYEGPYVYQQLCPLPEFDGRRPVIGSWMVNGHACGIGIREDATLVTGNGSRFVPHVLMD